MIKVYVINKLYQFYNQLLLSPNKYSGLKLHEYTCMTEFQNHFKKYLSLSMKIANPLLNKSNSEC